MPYISKCKSIMFDVACVEFPDSWCYGQKYPLHRLDGQHEQYSYWSGPNVDCRPSYWSQILSRVPPKERHSCVFVGVWRFHRHISKSITSVWNIAPLDYNSWNWVEYRMRSVTHEHVFRFHQHHYQQVMKTEIGCTWVDNRHLLKGGSYMHCCLHEYFTYSAIYWWPCLDVAHLQLVQLYSYEANSSGASPTHVTTT